MKTCPQRIINKIITPLHRTAQLTILLTVVIFLAACGEESPVASIDSKPADTAPQVSSEMHQAIELNFSETPIDKGVFLGLVVPEIKMAAPCPLLSDETAVATAKTDWVLKRRDTSESQCVWSKNSGFSIKLTVEPLTTAKPVTTRAYNLDSKPVLKPQVGPGQNSVVLYDTTWDNERPYAIAFEQQNKQVMIYVTGLNTNVERLTAAANEVALKMSNTTMSAPQVNESVAFDMCSIWSQTEVEKLVGSPVSVIPGNLDCQWVAGQDSEQKQIRVTIYSGKSYPWDSLIERGSIEVDGVGERGLIERKRKKGNRPGHVLMNALYDEKLVTVTVTDTLHQHEAVAVALSKNIDQRLKQTL